MQTWGHSERSISSWVIPVPSTATKPAFGKSEKTWTCSQNLSCLHRSKNKSTLDICPALSSSPGDDFQWLTHTFPKQPAGTPSQKTVPTPASLFRPLQNPTWPVSQLIQVSDGSPFCACPPLQPASPCAGRRPRCRGGRGHGASTAVREAKESQDPGGGHCPGSSGGSLHLLC